MLWDEFVKTPQLIAAGEAATLEAMPRIKSLLDRGPGRPDGGNGGNGETFRASE